MPEKSPYSREGEALHIVEHTVDEGVIPPQQERDLISAIAEALDEAHKAGSAAKDATIAEQAERIAKLEARLEIDHVFQWKGDGEEPVRVEIAMEDRDTIPDGITARDSTIKLQDEALSRKNARISELEQTVSKAFLRVQELESALGEAREIADRVAVEHIHIQPDWSDGVAWSVEADAGFIRRGKQVYDKIMGVMQPSANAEAKGSAQALPNDQSDEGEAR